MIPGPQYFDLALRLTAYAGVMQGLALEQDQERNGTNQAPTGGTSPKTDVISDTDMLAKLANEGWAEHVVEE